VVLGRRLDFMILEVFSNIDDSVILGFCDPRDTIILVVPSVAWVE